VKALKQTEKRMSDLTNYTAEQLLLRQMMLNLLENGRITLEELEIIVVDLIDQYDSASQIAAVDMALFDPRSQA
jgi:hypothetical protein